jgi:hypothetical protein
VSIILNLDPLSQRTLEEAFGGNLTRTTLEALVAEGYRTEKLSRLQVQQLLGLPDRWTAETWLKEHDVFPMMTLDNVLRDAETSRRAREA